MKDALHDFNLKALLYVMRPDEMSHAIVIMLLLVFICDCMYLSVYIYQFSYCPMKSLYVCVSATEHVVYDMHRLRSKRT